MSQRIGGVISIAVASAVLAVASTARTEPLIDLGTQTFSGAAAGKGGPAFSLDMGKSRVNWTNARWSVAALPAAKDLSKFGGVKLTVATDTPRNDAGVYLALRETGGAWWVIPWAAPLSQAVNTGTAHFDDAYTADYTAPSSGDGKDTHVDKNGRLDLVNISHIAIGCINPLGVGKVEFTLTAMEALPKVAPAAPAAIDVTGKLLDVNGTTAIPAGVFGGFHAKWQVDGKSPFEAFRLAQDRRINPGKPEFGNATTWMMINTYGDRSGKSPRVSNPRWKEEVAALGTNWGNAGKAAGKPLFVEFWNEPYLNWSNKNRVTYSPDNFMVDQAREGGEVKLKSDGTVVPHLKWTQNYDVPAFNWASPRFVKDRDGVERDNWRRGKDKNGKMWSAYYVPPSWAVKSSSYNPAHHPPKDVKDGETYKVKVIDAKTKAVKEDVELTAFTPWYPYDETQFTFWSAAGTGLFYNEPMAEMGKALKAANPDATYIAGWGFRPSEDHWAAWNLNYKPTIDAGAPYLDGICDHDYGGEPTKMAANYEVVTAYGKTRHNRWLRGYNTEAAASIDPQAYANAEGAGPDAVKFGWGARKLMNTLSVVPDKAGSIAWFLEGNGFVTRFGEGTALELLKNLRGKLVYVRTSDPFVYVVASVDGTDPRNPRPADMPQRQELVVAVLNDRREVRDVDLSIAPPKGAKFDTVIIRRADVSGPSPKIVETQEKVSGGVYTLKAALASRDLVVYTFPLTGEVAADAKAEATRTQFFSPDVVVDVTPEKPLETTIAVAPAALTGGKAWVRFVAERLVEGEGIMVLNGKEYRLPSCVSPENNPLVRQFAIDLNDLKPANVLTFKTAPGQPGYFIGMSSILIEKE